MQLKLDRSGGVAVFCGETEIGQGSDSVVAAVVAEVLGIDLDDIRLCVGDTDLTPVDLGSYSSRVTLMCGNAALQAAQRARDLIAKAVGEKLEVPANRLVFADRRVCDAEDPEDDGGVRARGGAPGWDPTVAQGDGTAKTDDPVTPSL